MFSRVGEDFRRFALNFLCSILAIILPIMQVVKPLKLYLHISKDFEGTISQNSVQ